MTHYPENGTKNWYQKTRIGFIHGVEQCSNQYQISVPEKNRYRIASHTCRKPVRLFWYRFLVPASGQCVMGLRVMACMKTKLDVFFLNKIYTMSMA